MRIQNLLISDALNHFFNQAVILKDYVFFWNNIMSRFGCLDRKISLYLHQKEITFTFRTFTKKKKVETKRIKNWLPFLK